MVKNQFNMFLDKLKGFGFKNKVLSGSFRFLALLIKMGFVFYIGKEMPQEALGEYGLITTTLTFITIIIGFDLYIEVQREIIKNQGQVKSIFINHLISLSLNYCLLIPILISINVVYGVIEPIFLFFLVLFGEHYGLEFFRFLIAKGESKWANIYILCKDVLWIFSLLAKWFFYGISTNFLHELLLFWGGFSTIVFISAFLIFLYRYKDDKYKFNLNEIKESYKVGVKYVFGSLAIRVVQFSDRFILLYFLTMKDLGVYTFFNQINNSINTLVFALTVSFAYPTFINLSATNDVLGFKKKKRSYNFELMFVFGFAVIGALIFLPSLLNYIGKEDFIRYEFLIYLLLIGNFVFNLSFPYHFALIGKKEDTILSVVNVISAVIAMVLSIIGIYFYGIIGGGMAKVASFSFIFLLKRSLYVKLVKPKIV